MVDSASRRRMAVRPLIVMSMIKEGFDQRRRPSDYSSDSTEEPDLSWNKDEEIFRPDNDRADYSLLSNDPLRELQSTQQQSERVSSSAEYPSLKTPPSFLDENSPPNHLNQTTSKTTAFPSSSQAEEINNNNSDKDDQNDQDRFDKRVAAPQTGYNKLRVAALPQKRNRRARREFTGLSDRRTCQNQAIISRNMKEQDVSSDGSSDEDIVEVIDSNWQKTRCKKGEESLLSYRPEFYNPYDDKEDTSVGNSAWNFDIFKALIFRVSIGVLSVVLPITIACVLVFLPSLYGSAERNFKSVAVMDMPILDDSAIHQYYKADSDAAPLRSLQTSINGTLNSRIILNNLVHNPFDYFIALWIVVSVPLSLGFCCWLFAQRSYQKVVAVSQ